MLEEMFWTWMCLALDARLGGSPHLAARAAAYFAELEITDLRGPSGLPLEK
jgi:hypothetical protein